MVILFLNKRYIMVRLTEAAVLTLWGEITNVSLAKMSGPIYASHASQKMKFTESG